MGKKIIYTRKQLLDDICTVEDNVENQDNDDFLRDTEHYKAVIQYLLNPQFENTNIGTKDYKRLLELRIKGNEDLKGYNYFLSSNKNFNYTWSYLRKQVDSFIEYLYQIENFIDSMLIDINNFYDVIGLKQKIQLLINDVILIYPSIEDNRLKGRIFWNKFNCINNTQRGYSITALMDDIALFTIKRSNEQDIERLIDGVLKIKY